MIEINGSLHEGGGQILRTAVGLSALTGKPVRIYNIRAKRKNPGLRPQHLEGIKAVSELSSGKLTGAEIGSEEIEFHPGELKPKTIQVNIGTAGSIGLLFQSLKLPMSHTGGQTVVEVSGGATFGKWSPPLPYTQNVLLPTLSYMGYQADIKIKRHGFYPVGGAKVTISVQPSQTLTHLNLGNATGNPGNMVRLLGISIASKHLQSARVTQRQAESAERVLIEAGYQSKIETKYVDADCPGSGIVLWAETDTGSVLGSDGLGERGKPAEKVGAEAAKRLLDTIKSGARVDEHLSDQVLPFMALAKGKSEILAPHLTPHTKTNIWVIEQFLKTEFKVSEGTPAKIVCSGLL
jgi:RNA 3'-phosphate cyclase